MCRKVWDALTGDELHSFEHKHIVRACAFSEVELRVFFFFLVVHYHYYSFFFGLFQIGPTVQVFMREILGIIYLGAVHKVPHVIQTYGCIDPMKYK